MAKLGGRDHSVQGKLDKVGGLGQSLPGGGATFQPQADSRHGHRDVLSGSPSPHAQEGMLDLSCVTTLDCIWLELRSANRASNARWQGAKRSHLAERAPGLLPSCWNLEASVNCPAPSDALWVFSEGRKNIYPNRRAWK